MVLFFNWPSYNPNYKCNSKGAAAAPHLHSPQCPSLHRQALPPPLEQGIKRFFPLQIVPNVSRHYGVLTASTTTWVYDSNCPADSPPFGLGKWIEVSLKGLLLITKALSS